MNDPGPYIHFRLAKTEAIQDHLEAQYPGVNIAARTVENALRRGELKFYQLGQKRYTTPMLIEEWMQSCMKAAAAPAK